MYVTPVETSEICTIINGMKESSAGWDGIYAKIVKSTYNLYLDTLTHVFNLSITKGIFPRELKVAKVIALFKSQNSMMFDNYRPVSILPVFSKILEKLMYNRILSFINKHKVLFEYQFGFREKHGTDIALIVLLDKIMSSINDGEIVLGVFLDLSKAFDTVNHDILLKKLHKYGIRGVVYDWFVSYLSERSQYVSFLNHNSSQLKISCGVPQGSILGPLLFLIYVNDLANVSSVLFTLLFADDTNVFIHGKNLDDLITCMNQELEKISQWMNVNKLSLNVSKTKCIVFSLRKKMVSKYHITLNGEDIEQVDNIKFLGVCIDCKLTWNHHVQFVRKKISKALGILYKAKTWVKHDTMLTLYKCFIYPYIMYCIDVWGGTSKKNLLSILKLQKRAIRLITSSPYRSESAPLFQSLQILSVFQVYVFKLSVLMFKFVNGDVIESIKDMFSINKEIHDHFTRQSNKLHVPKCNKTITQTNVRFRGVKIWNYICDVVYFHCSLSCFKCNLKEFLIHCSPYNQTHSCIL